MEEKLKSMEKNLSRKLKHTHTHTRASKNSENKRINQMKNTTETKMSRQDKAEEFQKYRTKLR